MTLGKIAIDNSVRYIPQSGPKKYRDIKPKTIKAGSLPRKQNKNILQNNKFFKNIAAGGFGIIKWKMSYYFQLKIQIH